MFAPAFQTSHTLPTAAYYDPPRGGAPETYPDNTGNEPPLGYRDMVAVIKSLKKRAYFYKCKDHPIQPVCNREVCLKREHMLLAAVHKFEREPQYWHVQLSRANTARRVILRRCASRGTLT